MQKASEEVSSGMMTVFLGNTSKLKTAMLAAREYCRQRCSISKPVCQVANYLSPDCKVIGGHTEVCLSNVFITFSLNHVPRAWKSVLIT